MEWDENREVTRATKGPELARAPRVAAGAEKLRPTICGRFLSPLLPEAAPCGSGESCPSDRC
jgi:hypothetical protein